MYVRSLPSALAQKLKRKPFFAHFLSPVSQCVCVCVWPSVPPAVLQLPGTDEQLLYADSQLVVWAVTGTRPHTHTVTPHSLFPHSVCAGMSELTVASYTEDQYGVVQRVRHTHEHTHAHTHARTHTHTHTHTHTQSLSRLLGSLINLSQVED